MTDRPLEVGEYVLATKYDDGDPGDNWAVGFYAGSRTYDNGAVRYFVVDNDGHQIRAGGFRRVGRITAEVGNWLMYVAPHLEKCPPGTVNVWTMLTDLADPEAVHV